MAKTQHRLKFTIPNGANEEKLLIEQYYEEPLSKLFLDDVLKMIKEKASALPQSFKDKMNKKK